MKKVQNVSNNESSSSLDHHNDHQPRNCSPTPSHLNCSSSNVGCCGESSCQIATGDPGSTSCSHLPPRVEGRPVDVPILKTVPKQAATAASGFTSATTSDNHLSTRPSDNHLSTRPSDSASTSGNFNLT